MTPVGLSSAERGRSSSATLGGGVAPAIEGPGQGERCLPGEEVNGKDYKLLTFQAYMYNLIVFIAVVTDLSSFSYS